MLLQVDNLEVRYGLTRALHGFSLQVEEGQAVAVLGTNGAGKTTLLRTLSGYARVAARSLDLVVAAGSVYLDGLRVDRQTPDALVRLGLAHVPEGREIFRDLTTEENLRLGGYACRAGRDQLARVYDSFPILAERRRQRAETLSGGEQQMLAIGRALMASPRLLLLDEPSLGLAPVVVARIFAILQRIQAAGTALLLVEQNAHLALDFCDRAYVLENGRGVLSGSREELLSNEVIREFYLGITQESQRRSYGQAKAYRIRKRWR